jgi:Ferric uptake regulator family
MRLLFEIRAALLGAGQALAVASSFRTELGTPDLHVGSVLIVLLTWSHLGGKCTVQTVYNVLRTFTEVGLVRRIELAGRPGLYELRVGDNHHLVGRRCDAVADVDWAVGDTPCLTAPEVSSGELSELKRTRSVRHQLGDTAFDPEQPGPRATSHENETLREEKDPRV